MRRPTSTEWALIGDLFDQLDACSVAEQERRLIRSDISEFVRENLRSLLAAAGNRGILDTPAGPNRTPITPVIEVGALVGQFRILRLIGRGGAGEVYLAERIRGGFAQRVALKLLRSGDTDRAASFDTERAMLASLEHPGIARLIDGGTTADGRPYMAMEYVEGAAITEWCAVQRASLAKRLALFTDVCDAVVYAHARLVVHCDLKPANILIDGDGRARLLDFGIAKVLGDGLADGAATRLTPDYAAPEQLEGARPSVATDVFALGAVLFELLTGHPPWRASGSSLAAILRRVPGAPADPPSKAATADGPVAAARIRGDLDAIVTRAMRLAPADRYSSAEALAADVRRHMAMEPVAARARSRRYHADRFVRRHLAAVAAASLAVVATVGGAVTAGWQAHRAAIERDRARDEAERIDAANKAMLLMFRDASDASQMETLSVADMINGTTRRMLSSLPRRSPDAAPTIAALADVYLIIGNNAAAKTLLAGTLRRGIGVDDPIYTARLRLKLGIVFAAEGNIGEALPLLRQADTVWRGDPVRFAPETVESTGAMVLVLRRQGKADAAIALLEGNMPLAEQVLASDPIGLAARYANLATQLADAGRLAEAKELLARARSRMTTDSGPPSTPALNLVRLEADILNRLGDAVAAERLLHEVVEQRRRYYGPSIALAVDLLHLGRLLNQRDRCGEALPLLLLAAPMAAEHYGDRSQPSLQIKIAQAEALAMTGAAPNAAALLRSLTEIHPASDPPSPTLARYWRSSAAVGLATGNRAVAALDMSRAVGVVVGLRHAADGIRLENASLLRRLRR